jgi:acetyltransferase-like isoleucine patch superfamily enzyme
MLQNRKTYTVLRRNCKKVGENFPILLIKSLYYRVHGKRIFAHQNCSIRGLKNIQIGNRLEIGMKYSGFSHREDRTYLNIQGKLDFTSNYGIGRGCRFDISKNAYARFGEGFVNPNSIFIISHGLEVGDQTVISWNCQFLDDDFHRIKYSNNETRKDSIILIGKCVWIGSNVLVMKGARIPNGCVVAAGSMVNQPFEEENCLIAGTPARVIRRGIEWE